MSHKLRIQAVQAKSQQTAERRRCGKRSGKQFGKLLCHLVKLYVSAFESYNLHNYRKYRHTQHKGRKHKMEFRYDPNHDAGIQPKKRAILNRYELFLLNSGSRRPSSAISAFRRSRRLTRIKLRQLNSGGRRFFHCLRRHNRREKTIGGKYGNAG